MLLDAEQRGEVIAQIMGRLVRRPHGHAAHERIGHGQHRARLHRHAAQSLADHPLLDDLVRLRERRVGVTDLDVRLVLDVVLGVVVELRRAVLQRAELIAERGQRLPLDRDVGRGVDGERFRRGEDGGHRLADVADLADRERVVLATHARVRATAAALGARSAERNRLAVGPEVLSRHDAKDTRPRRRSRGVDAPDLRVRVRAANERHVLHAGHGDVADVRGGAGDESGIFLALDLGAHEPGSGGWHAWFLSWGVSGG